MRSSAIGWVILLSLILLGAQATLADSADSSKTPAPLDVYGAWDGSSWWYLTDQDQVTLEDGDVVMAIWSGPNQAIDPPVRAMGSPYNGNVTGDDVLLLTRSILWGGFYFYVTSWAQGDRDSLNHQRHPARDEWIYVRVFNGSDLVNVDYYGESNLYEVRNQVDEIFYAQLPNDPDGPTTDTQIFGRFFKVIGGINPNTGQTFKLKDNDGVELEDGSLAQLIWAGPNGLIDFPNGASRMPGGDDELADSWGVNEGMWPSTNTGVFRRYTASYDTSSHGLPAEGQLAYVRQWNSDNILEADWYGNSGLYTVTYTMGESLNVFYDDGVDCNIAPPDSGFRDLAINGGFDPVFQRFWPMQDVYGLRLHDDDVVQLIEAGPNAAIDAMDEATGLPTGDDVLLNTFGIGYGLEGIGTGRFKYETFTTETKRKGDLPAMGDHIYLRCFDHDIIGEDSGALWYGESEIYEVQWEFDEEFCSFPDSSFDATERVPWYKTIKIFGGVDTSMTQYPMTDIDGNMLEAGDLVQIIWAGTDSLPSDMDSTGMPTGDDSLLTTTEVGQGYASDPGLFKIELPTFAGHKGGFPAQGDWIFVRVFDSTDVHNGKNYGESDLHKVAFEQDEEFFSFPDTTDDAVLPNPAYSFVAEWNTPTASLPTEYALYQNYPNPFNPETDIQYQIPEAGPVELTIYNVLGQEVYALIDGHRDAGKYTVRWYGTDSNGRALSSGIYFYRLRAGEFTDVRKMVLLK